MPLTFRNVDNTLRAANSGADGIRTHYLFSAIEALSQLSYGPGRERFKYILMRSDCQIVLPLFCVHGDLW